jgi:hypothetical protein
VTVLAESSKITVLAPNRQQPMQKNGNGIMKRYLVVVDPAGAAARAAARHEE